MLPLVRKRERLCNELQTGPKPSDLHCENYCNDKKVLGDTFPQPMLIGHARVSTNEQDTTAQASALKSAGCERIFREKAVWKLDPPSRSLRDVLTIMERIQEVKAGFRSLTEAIDTTTPAGRMRDADDWLVRRIRTSHASRANAGRPRIRP